MLSYEDALDRMLADVHPCGRDLVPLHDALGRRLAEPLEALLTHPPFAGSAMDGYAVRFADLPGPLRVVGESAAGERYGRALGCGEAVRIFTGAPLPDGADTVVIQEDIERSADVIRVSGDGPGSIGRHVRAKGFDFREGQELASTGMIVTPALIGLAAAAGHARLPVYKGPTVRLLATGSELVPPGCSPGPDQIISSNGIMLAALLQAEGAQVTDVGIIADELGSIASAIESARGADVLVTIGGASVGDHDLVKPALEQAGATIGFWKIAIRPGKPMLSGTLATTRIVGLPGNPASAFVCATLFILPLIRKLAGSSDPIPQKLSATLDHALPANGKRRDHLRAKLRTGPDGPKVGAADTQDSSALLALAHSNCFIIRPPFAPALRKGEPVPVLPLDNARFVS